LLTEIAPASVVGCEQARGCLLLASIAALLCLVMTEMPMQVFRRRRMLRCAALLALAMQALLAFAQTHTHTHSHTYSFSFAGADALPKRAMTYGMCPESAEHACPAPAPHDDHGTCTLCVLISLASAAVVNAPPTVALIRLPIETPPPVRTAEAAPSVSTVHFQARAPPSV
jgi:hypothetical protein